MKKLAAVAVSIGVILVIIGLVIVGIFAGGQVGNLFEGFTHNFDKADKTIEITGAETAEINVVDIWTNIYAVYICASETDSVHVKYPSEIPKNYNAEISVNVNGQSLSIVETDSVVYKKMFNFTDVIFNPNNFIVVYLPATQTFAQSQLTAESKFSFVSIADVTFSNVAVTTTESGSVKINKLSTGGLSANANAGSITIDNVKVQGSVTLNTGAGSVNADDVECLTFNSKTSAGSIHADNIKAQQVALESKAGSVSIEDIECKTFRATTEAGTVKAHDIVAAESVFLQSKAGSIRCEADTPQLTIKSEAGSVKFETNATSIDLFSGAGSIKGTIDGAQSEYQIEVKKGVGSSNISNQTVPNATKFLKVNANAGSIHIDFDND